MSWLWNFGDGNQSTIQNPNHVFDTVGVYNVQLTVTTLCGFDSVSKIITILPNGISELSQSKFIKIYPNPASNLLYLQSKFISNAIISIFDNQGREVFANFKNSINNETKLIDISSLESGFYFVKVNATNGIETVFFTKQ
jgi:hypothetical protein